MKHLRNELLTAHLRLKFAQLIGVSQHKNKNPVSFTDAEFKFAVVVAESRPQLRALSHLYTI